MCFKKKEVVSPNATVEELARPYIERKKKLSELDLSKESDVCIALRCLIADHSRVSEFSGSNENELKVLKYWISPRFFKYDKYKKYFCVDHHDWVKFSNYLLCVRYGADYDELLTLYLEEKFRLTISDSDKNVLQLLTSLDKKLAIEYKYETKREETVSYFDKTLGVPTSLAVAANLKLKLADARKLVKIIDVDIEQINMNIVKIYITSVLNKIIRDSVLTFIAEKDLSFYDLPRNYTAISDAISAKLGVAFGESGLQVANFSIFDISITDNTSELVHDQFFAIAEAERVKMHEYKMEREALDLYERKAAIHSKYPDFPVTLTEAEKDFALNRYKEREGQGVKLTANIKSKQLESRGSMIDSGTVTKVSENKPTLFKKMNNFRRIYAAIAFALFLVGCILFSVSLTAGFIGLACATFISGIVAFVCFDKFKTRVVEVDADSVESDAGAESSAESDSKEDE